jgi:hypothetical protein
MLPAIVVKVPESPEAISSRAYPLASAGDMPSSVMTSRRCLATAGAGSMMVISLSGTSLDATSLMVSVRKG